MCSELTREVVDEALAGDVTQQERLVATLQPVIHFEVAKMLRRWRTGPASARDLRQEIEDLVQEVFLELFKNDGRVLRRWDPEILPLCKYAGHIARIKTAEFLRSPRSPWRENPQSEEELNREEPRETPEDEAVTGDVLRKVLECLERGFSPTDEVLFDLYFRKQLSPKEIAKRTGKSVDAIYQWLSRLRKRARKCLEEVSN